MSLHGVSHPFTLSLFHSFTFSPFHLFTFKRRQPSFHPFTFSPFHPFTLFTLFTFKSPFYINLKLQSTMNTKKLSTFKLIIKVIAAIATAVLGVIAGKGLGDED